jgi:excisionase family DNA binding protein
MNQAMLLPNVLTLEETADYLRLPKETVERQASRGRILGRRIEETWRFLRDAIDDWLRQQDSRIILLQQAGAFAEDEMLPDLRAAIYAARGRSETTAGAHP